MDYKNIFLKPKKNFKYLKLDIEKTDSGCIIPLKRVQTQLFDIVKELSVEDLKSFLERNENIDINVENNLGYTPLAVAVIKNDLKMVKYLIKKNSLIQDAHLLAVERGHVDIASYLLKKIAQTKGHEAELKGVENSSAFPSYMTPMMLAAQANNLSMMQMLLERGHPAIGPICKPYCSSCKDHKLNKNYHGYRRNVYLSLANPMYICLTEEDPILASFKLCSRMRQESRIDREYASTYLELIQKVEKFIVGLVSQCRDVYETEIILSKTKQDSKTDADVALPRLQLAVKYNEKAFIAAPPIQCLILQKYYDHRLGWNWKPFYAKVIEWLTHVVVLPYVAFARVLFPNSSFVNHFTTPQSKVIFHFSSLLIFNIMLFCLMYLNLERKAEGPPETGIEWFIIIWVLGFVRGTIKKVCLLGIKKCFQRFWIIYEFILEFFFIITFFFWGKSAVEAVEDEIKGEDKKEIDRSKWDEFNSTLIHEACFAMSTFLSCFFLLYYLQINSILGPWQVSIIKMAKKIYFALAFAAVILFPIAMILTSLYHNYRGNRQETETGETITQPTGFTTIFDSIYSLFWTILSGANPDMASVVTNTTQERQEPKNHWLTKITGYFLYTFFCLLMQIALVNTLIAIISNTFQKVIDNADIEWKFVRTDLILNHMEEMTPMPPPFNLIVGLPELKALIKWFQEMKENFSFKLSKKGFKYKVETSVSDQAMLEYKACIAELLTRYLQSKKREEYENRLKENEM